LQGGLVDHLACLGAPASRSQSAVEVLRAHRIQQAAEQLAAAEAWRDSDLVFTTEVGTPLEPRNVLRRFETLPHRAGLRDVHLHTLRHSTASFLLAAGTHTKVVQEHLGHPSYAITADSYSHVAPAQRREAADRLDKALEWSALLYATALLYRLLYSRKRRAGPFGRPASDLLFHCRADRI
jgi:hypothetical protein